VADSSGRKPKRQARHILQPSSGRGASAVVHRPVLEGRVRATYVAHRGDAEWFVGGPGFTEDASDRFQVVALTILRRIDPSVAPALSLPVGSHASRPFADGRWRRGRIPQGHTWRLTHEVRPSEAVSEGGTIGGAFANCWVVARTIGEARRRSRRHLEDIGWAVVVAGQEQRMHADELAEGTERYFRQVQVDGLVCILHTFPPEPTDA
jgi:hypothetical protein